MTWNTASGSAGVTVEGGGIYTDNVVTSINSAIAHNRPDQCVGCWRHGDPSRNGGRLTASTSSDRRGSSRPGRAAGSSPAERPGRCLSVGPRGTSTASPGYHWTPVTLAPNDFTHLHVHSEFSLLDGLGRINELVAQAEEAGLRVARHYGSRGTVRGGRLLPGVQGGGHQAHPGRGDLHRPPLDGRSRGQGRR